MKIRPILPGLLAMGLALIGRTADAHTELPAAQVARQFCEFSLREEDHLDERPGRRATKLADAAQRAAELAGGFRSDGSWSDIDYASQSRSAWPPATHLERTLELVKIIEGNELTAAVRADGLQAIHRALKYWQQHDYYCPNWWYNDIGVPWRLGHIALLLGADLQAEEREYIAQTVLARSKVGAMTGQNRVWLAANGLMRGVLLADDALSARAAAVIQEEIRVGPGEGIQIDESFHQHGPQQQFGNYGLGYAWVMSQWAAVLRGTAWALPEEKMSVLRRFLLEGEGWAAWCGALDISACGRQLFPGSPRAKANALREIMRVMADTDADHAAGYHAFVQRNQEGTVNDLTGCRCFWRSDYLVRRGLKSMVSLKMASDRVIGGESINDENLSGVRLADGATFFYRSGHEYDDIFPVWDWRMVPGTTGVLGENPPRWPKGDPRKSNGWAGGVTDGHDGCAAMEFRRDGLRASKAWFFVDDTVVCLGSGIISDDSQPVATTVNQCLLRGPVTVQRAGQRELLDNQQKSLTGIDWLEHDGWRYTPLGAEALQFSSGPQRGDWRRVFNNPDTPKEEITREVFKLWLAHRGDATGASYAYSVAPMEKADRHPAIRVLSNTAQAQAVRAGENKDAWTGVVLRAAGRVELDKIAVAADGPCLLLGKDGCWWASDPTHQRRTLRLEIDAETRTVELPQGQNAGKTVELPVAR